MFAKILLKNGEIRRFPIREGVEPKYDGKIISVVAGGKIAAMYNIDFVLSLETEEEPVRTDEDSEEK